MFYVFSFPPGVYVGTLNLIASTPGCSILTLNNTPGPLYNTVHYNTVLDIKPIIVGPKLNYFYCMSVCFTLVITRMCMDNRLAKVKR